MIGDAYALADHVCLLTHLVDFLSNFDRIIDADGNNVTAPKLAARNYSLLRSTRHVQGGRVSVQGQTRMIVFPLRRLVGLKAATASSMLETLPMCVRSRPSLTRWTISIS